MMLSAAALCLPASAAGLLYLATVVSGYVVNVIVQHVTDPITCWTCPNMTDNTACNAWAPDEQCPQNFSVCQTIHRIDTRSGGSILVNKRCALARDCTVNMIGCQDTDIPGVQNCMSCCNYAYCNEHVPFNITTAVMYSKLAESSGGCELFNRWRAALTAVLAMAATLVSIHHGDMFALLHSYSRDNR